MNHFSLCNAYQIVPETVFPNYERKKRIKFAYSDLHPVFADDVTEELFLIPDSTAVGKVTVDVFNISNEECDGLWMVRGHCLSDVNDDRVFAVPEDIEL